MRFTKAMRVRAAATLALAYALCVLAPPVALAFTEGAQAFRCVTGHHHQQRAAAAAHSPGAQAHDRNAPVHVHSDGSAHRHGAANDSGANKTDENGTVGDCCGYFCVSAVPASPLPDVVPMLGMFIAVAAVDNGIGGRGPDRIDRPPILLLPQ